MSPNPSPSLVLAIARAGKSSRSSNEGIKSSDHVASHRLELGGILITLDTSNWIQNVQISCYQCEFGLVSLTVLTVQLGLEWKE